MKFVLMMNHPGKMPYQITSWKPAEITAHIAFMKDFAVKLTANGELVAAEGLAGPDQAKLVSASPEGDPITDGVFPESKEFLQFGRRFRPEHVIPLSPITRAM